MHYVCMHRALLENKSPGYNVVLSLSVGHFAFIRASKSERQEIAQLESESMAAVDRACLELWHISEGWLADSEYNLRSYLYAPAKHWFGHLGFCTLQLFQQRLYSNSYVTLKHVNFVFLVHAVNNAASAEEPLV